MTGLATQPDPTLIANACVLAGFAGVLFWLLDNPGRVPALARYEASLDRAFERTLLPRRGVAVVRAQICICAVLAASAIWSALLLTAIPLIFWLPRAWQEREQVRRVTDIEMQLDGWLMALTSALRAAPALGNAMGSTLALVRGPLRAELALVMRLFRLGTPLDEGLDQSARRVGSPSLSAVVATLRIARRTGGDMSTTLEENAATLREMARLEGVVRAKTAGGRAQANAISVIPVAMVGGLHSLDPNFLAPVINTAEGNMIAAVACLMWIVAVVWARLIVAVEI